MKKVLGLDVGTNSIGGSLVTIGTLTEYGKGGSIEWMGSRIIPVDGDMLQKFESGGLVESKAADSEDFFAAPESSSIVINYEE